jgi:creatinine amidohydrolase/Fe(II)-dependent formamide hydrolase-like protein
LMGQQVGSHASAGETAFMLAVRPNAVKLHRVTGHDAPVRPSREITTVQTFAQKYPDGMMGSDPHGATRAVGEALLKKCVEICARELSDWPEHTKTE